MSKVKVYFQTFDTVGDYSGEWVDVTDDVNGKMGTITQKLDANEFDVGVFTFGSFNLKLNNIDGTYSDTDNINSMFVGKRSGTKVKLTYQIEHEEQYCGIAICGNSFLSDEVDLLTGLLNDESFAQDLVDSSVQFKVLAEESIFDKIEVNFAALSNGQTVSQILNIILTDTEIQKILTIDTITPNYNAVIDDVSGFENENVREILNRLLVISNSVLNVIDSAIFVTGRIPTTEVQQTFYGQASNLGIENIQSLKKIKSGLSRTFNVWNWEDTALTAKNINSQGTYGTRDKAISYESVTTTATRQAILDDYVDEFGNPKRELACTITMDGYNIRSLLDKINIDYPTPYSVKEGNVLPLYGAAVYGVDVYPDAEFGLELTTDEFWKVIAIKMELDKLLITYDVREI